MNGNLFSKFVDYDPVSGDLTWAIDRHGRGCKKGHRAGTIAHRKDTSYLAIMINGKKYYAHRIAWELINGPIPDGKCVDHIDGNGLNNVISNLRVVSLSDNQKNSKTPSNNKTGLAGVTKRNEFFHVHAAGKYIGISKDFFEACCLRKSASNTLNFHPNHGRAQ